ncbi:MAG: Gfo/Idh/MocA family oxidoreductase [Gammaproteobacteria bacterium]
MKTLKTAVIGVGHYGNYHAQKYAALENSDLVAIVDSNPDRAAQIAEELGATGLTDYRELIGKVDAVSVVVPTQYHYQIAKEFLENGTHTLVEKPITPSVDEAAKLTAIANANDLILQVGHLERFNPVVLALEQDLREPKFIESNRVAPFSARSTDVNVVLDLMIHDIDLIHGMVRSPVDEISANGTPVISEKIDIANARLQFANGCVANVTASRVGFKTERLLRMFEQDAYISVDMHNRILKVYRRTEGGSQTSRLPGVSVHEQAYEKGDALMLEIEAFLESCATGKPPVVSGDVAREALDTAMRINQIMAANNG